MRRSSGRPGGGQLSILAPQAESLLRGRLPEDAERLLIRKALERYGGSVSQAAKGLGLL